MCVTAMPILEQRLSKHVPTNTQKKRGRPLLGNEGVIWSNYRLYRLHKQKLRASRHSRLPRSEFSESAVECEGKNLTILRRRIA
jgi:hypothetical protein